MTRADIAAGLLLTALFGAALWEASSFQFGTEFAPGPGFAPVWLSSIGILISLLIAIGGWRSARRSAADASRGAQGRDGAIGDTAGLIRVTATLAALAAMIAAVAWIGFVPAMLAFLLVLTLAIQRMAVVTALAASFGTVAFIYTIFVYFLHVPIPAGPLGF